MTSQEVPAHPTEVDVRLGSTGLPKGDANGLAPHSSMLVRPENRKKLWVALAILSVPVLVEDTDKNSTQAKVRIRRVELIVDPADANDLQRILMRAYERRTGAAVLPLELEHDVEAAFNGLDPDMIAREEAQAADERAAAETNEYLANRERERSGDPGDPDGLFRSAEDPEDDGSHGGSPRESTDPDQ